MEAIFTVSAVFMTMYVLAFYALYIAPMMPPVAEVIK